MTTFYATSINTMAAVAEVIDDLETKGHEVHTVTLVLNGQHGEFDLTVLATTDPGLENVTAKGIAHRSGGVSELVVDEPEEVEDDEDELIEFRVTIDGRKAGGAQDQWEYTVEDETRDGARQQAVALAVNDELDTMASHTIQIEEL